MDFSFWNDSGPKFSVLFGNTGKPLVAGVDFSRSGVDH